jgi:hypothetical protein
MYIGPHLLLANMTVQPPPPPGSRGEVQLPETAAGARLNQWVFIYMFFDVFQFNPKSTGVREVC